MHLWITRVSSRILFPLYPFPSLSLSSSNKRRRDAKYFAFSQMSIARWEDQSKRGNIHQPRGANHTRTFWIHLFQRYLYQDRSLGWTFFQAHETASCSFDLMYSYVIIRASFLMQDWRILNYRSIIHTRLVRPFSKALKIYYERRDLKTHTESDKSLQFVLFSFDESLWSRISVN